MDPVYEIVRSRVRPGAEAKMLDLRPAMIRAIRERHPDLLDARLVRLDDGTWLDIVRWRSRTAATVAAQDFAAIPEARAMLELIDEVLSFEHGVAAEPGVLVD